MYNGYNYGSAIQNATQPFSYPMSPYYNNSMFQPQNNMVGQNSQQQNQSYTNTNKIYVSGIDDVKNRLLQPNSDVIFLDNDKPILYQKVVDSKGQFEIKQFTIAPYEPKKDTEKTEQVDLSLYAKIDDLKSLQSEIKELKEQMSKYNKPMEVKNGTIGANSIRPTQTTSI